MPRFGRYTANERFSRGQHGYLDRYGRMVKGGLRGLDDNFFYHVNSFIATRDCLAGEKIGWVEEGLTKCGVPDNAENGSRIYGDSDGALSATFDDETTIGADLLGYSPKPGWYVKIHETGTGVTW